MFGCHLKNFNLNLASVKHFEDPVMDLAQKQVQLLQLGSEEAGQPMTHTML